MRSVGFEILLADDGHRHFGDQADIFESVQRVIGKLAVERGAGGHADVVQKQRVAIRIGLRDAARAKRAAGAADIFHHDLLTQILRHRLGDQTGHGIRRTAGREGHDHGDGALGISLCASAVGAERERCGDAKGGEKLCHSFLPGSDILSDRPLGSSKPVS